MEIALARFPRVFIEKIKFNWLRKVYQRISWSPFWSDRLVFAGSLGDPLEKFNLHSQ